MTNTLRWVAMGILLGFLAAFFTTPAAARTAIVMFGNLSGAAKAIAVTTDGHVNVSIQ